MPRSIATALTLVLLLGMLPAASAAAAEDGPPSRTPADAIGTSLDLDALMTASHELALDTALKVQVASLKLDVAKAAQRERARQYRRDKRAVKKALSGKERDCRLAALERTYLAERDRFEAEAMGYRAEMGYSNRQKALTKAGKHLARAGRWVGKRLVETIKEVGPVVLEAQLTGGLGPGGWKALARRHGVRTLKRKGKDALFGALVRRAAGPPGAALATATEECEPEAAVAAPAPASRDRLGTTTVAADAECEGWTPEIPSPPFEERAIVIRVDWDGSDKYWYFYYATTADDPVNEWRTVDVDTGHHAHASGGCTPDAERCGRRDPLFLTEASLDSAYVRDGAPIPHNNHASAPGSYSLAALVGDVCTYPDDPGVISHYERYFQDMTSAPSEVKFSATIEYYERGAAQPHRTATRHTMVPLDNRLDMDLTGPSFTRVFGEPIVLAPASGASGVGSNGAAPWDREDSEVE